MLIIILDLLLFVCQSYQILNFILTGQFSFLRYAMSQPQGDQQENLSHTEDSIRKEENLAFFKLKFKKSKSMQRNFIFEDCSSDI